jgi:hypothetical protein
MSIASRIDMESIRINQRMESNSAIGLRRVDKLFIPTCNDKLHCEERKALSGECAGINLQRQRSSSFQTTCPGRINEWATCCAHMRHWIRQRDYSELHVTRDSDHVSSRTTELSLNGASWRLARPQVCTLAPTAGGTAKYAGDAPGGCYGELR